MDPLCASASVMALLGNVQKVMGIRDIGDYTDPEISDIPVLAALYRDINAMLLSSANTPLYSTKQALLRCRETQDKLFEVLDDLGYSKFKHSKRRRDRIRYSMRRYFKRSKLQAAQKNFREAVLLLRDTAMDSVTHRHLENIKQGLRKLLETSEVGNGDRAAAIYSLASDNSDPSLFNATVVPVSSTGVRHCPARGKFDTGSDINLISRHFLEREDISAEERELDQKQSYESIEGIHHEAKSKVKVHWFLNNTPYTQVTEFFPVNDNSFDLLLGNPFIREKQIFYPNPKVLMMGQRKVDTDKQKERAAREQEKLEEEEKKRQKRRQREVQKEKDKSAVVSDRDSITLAPSTADNTPKL